VTGVNPSSTLRRIFGRVRRYGRRTGTSPLHDVRFSVPIRRGLTKNLIIITYVSLDMIIYIPPFQRVRLS
jgi:hypothetical protein